VSTSFQERKQRVFVIMKIDNYALETGKETVMQTTSTADKPDIQAYIQNSPKLSPLSRHWYAAEQAPGPLSEDRNNEKGYISCSFHSKGRSLLYIVGYVES